ncbi:hypothetical protein BJY52DRAFT_783293 [Lactarius psammicola]|nr:hypothetical protein BJY52DRAFT_783293 [Lactarius psammicola]
MHNTHHSCHCRPHSPLVHPSFPSFAWVMTAQANPPTHARRCKCKHTPLRLAPHLKDATGPTLPPAKPLLPSLPPSASAPAEVSFAAPHEFMETVDYRYHDLPARPYIPWRAVLTEKGRIQMITEVPVPVASPSCAKRKRLDSVLWALRRACGHLKGTRPGRRAA